MSDIFDLIKRYPWLPSLKTYYSDIESEDPIKFINDIFTSDKIEKLKEKILNLFSDALNNIEQIVDYEFDEINIKIYLLLRILLYILNNKIISNRIANIYSKTTYNELNKENEYNLYFIYQDLNLDVVFEDKQTLYKKIVVKDQQELYKTNFRISYIDYLKLASNLKDDYRSLVNNAVLHGYVYIKTENLNRLLQEYVRSKLLINNNDISIDLEDFTNKLFKIQDFKNLFDQITKLWESKKEDFAYSIDMTYKEGMDISESFPPCVKEILSKAREGQNLIHTERLFILWFLNSLKYPEEKIINVFSTLPDFDEEKTAYQVKYAMKKGYTPYSCKSLKSYNLCFAKQYKDKLCLEGYFSKLQNEQKTISHPLKYIEVQQYRSSRNSQRNKKQDTDKK
jgi:DNA primase large subunit